LKSKRYVLAVLVEDKPSALTRVSGLFARRAFNIHSLAVGPSESEGISRITIVTDESSNPIEQIVNQLRKLIYVIKIDVMQYDKSIEREIALIKVNADINNSTGGQSIRTAIIEVANIFRANVVDVTPQSFTIEATGNARKLKGLIEALEPYGVLEIVKSGTIAIKRGSDTITDVVNLGDAE
jgi:acetolactate synthase-1/3 small subunit